MNVVRVAAGTIRAHIRFRRPLIDPPIAQSAPVTSEVRARAQAEIEFGIPRWKLGESGRVELADIYARARGSK